MKRSMSWGSAVGVAARSDAKQRRREIAWAWASLVALIVSWDAALRLDERVSLPRMRVAQETQPARVEWVSQP